MTATTTPPITFANADPESAVSWRVTPETERAAAWEACRQHWLNALAARTGRDETRRAYERDVLAFQLFLGGDTCLWEIQKTHVWGWIEEMRTRGLAPATINRRLAALSSLYTFAAQEFGLWTLPNPFEGKALRTSVEPYARSRFMTTDECIHLFAAIDSATPTGLRDLCIFFGMFATTRRVSEWINLRYGDIHHDGETHWFAYRYKGGSTRRQVIPPDLWRLLSEHIRRSGRSAPESYLFVATTAAARRFANTRPGYDPANQPLSASWVNRLLHRYGIPLGIAPERLHAHALRHAGARFREEHGAPLKHLRDVLGHKNISTTEIYAGRVLAVPVDEFCGVVGDVLPPHLRSTYHEKTRPARTGAQSAQNRRESV